MIRKTLVGILSSVMLGCGAAAPPDPVVIPSSCASIQSAKGTVVGCDLAPRVALLGVDEQAFYVVAGNRTFFHVARDTGQPTKLYHSQASYEYTSEAALHLTNTAFQDGKIYLLDQYIKDGRYSSVLASLDAHTPGNSNPILPVAQGLGAVFADGYAYFQDRLVASGTPAPLVRVPLGGGATQVLYAGEGQPFAVHGGYVYFLNVDYAVHRVPITGGTSNLILPKLPRASATATWSIAVRDLAVDDNYLYVPVPSLGPGQPHTLKRFAVTGGDSGTVIANIMFQVEVPVSPPAALRVDEGYLYFVLGDELERTKLGGDGERKWIATTKSPPSFDKTSIYVTDQIGGEEAPLQGVIVQIPK